MFKCASEGPDLRSGTRHPRSPEAAGGRSGWIIGLPEARWITPQPSVIVNLVCLAGAGLSPLLKAKSGREGRGWCQLQQLEEELCQTARPTNQVAEVFHLIDGEDSRRRVLCPWRAHPLASTLPAVARATAGRFMRCEWLVGRVACVLRGSSSGLCVGRSPRRVSLEIGGPRGRASRLSAPVAETPNDGPSAVWRAADTELKPLAGSSADPPAPGAPSSRSAVRGISCHCTLAGWGIINQSARLPTQSSRRRASGVTHRQC